MSKGHWDDRTYVPDEITDPPKIAEMGLPYNQWQMTQQDMTYIFSHEDYPTVVFYWAPTEGVLSGVISYNAKVQSELYICHDRSLVSGFVQKVLGIAELPFHKVSIDDIHFTD